MKNLLLLLLVSTTFWCCENNVERTSYEITGQAEGIHNGIRVYLKGLDANGRQVPLDTAIVMNEAFTMTGKVEEPSVSLIAADGVPGQLFFMLENEAMTIALDDEVLMKSEVSGSESHKVLKTYTDGLEELQKTELEALEKYRNAIIKKDSLQLDGLKAKVDAITKDINAYAIEFINEHPESYFSLNLLGLEMNKPNIDVKAFVEAYDHLDEDLKTSNKAKAIKPKLDKMYEDFKKLSYLDIGKKAPEFEAPSPKGDMISLESIRGKVTIIDFWAAWCGPCRRENPNVVRIYNKYHDKGLEIIGVSLDGSSRQKDPKKAWLEAIEKDNLTWHHVSYLEYFNDPVARLYNIQAIPATYVLDENGTIVAKNLRGRVLENKIIELLDGK